MGKKINLDELQELLKMKSQKECAEHFQCSGAAICKAAKKLKAADVEEPPTFAALTDKEKKFVIGKVVEGKTNTQAAQSAYEVTSLDSAKSLGYTMMQNPKIQESIAEIMNLNGLTKENRIQLLSKWAHCKDGNISLKALDQSWKLTGDYAPLQIDIEDDISRTHLQVFLLQENEKLKARIKELENPGKVETVDCYVVKEIPVITSAECN